MWCEDFLSAYRTKSANRLCEFYDRWSVFIEIVGDGGWTKPLTGSRKIIDRLVKLNLVGGHWPVETCQRTRTGGMLVVLMTANGDRQILIVYQSTDGAQRVLVRNHFYLTPTGHGATDGQMSFQTRFACWAESQDRDTLERYQTALFNGLTVARDYYASSAGRPGHRPRWNQYDPQARFSYTRNGQGSGRLYIGLQSIRKRFNRLALDYRYAKVRTINTCWTIAPGDRTGKLRATVVLVTGTVPEVTGPGNRAHREFMQFFVIDALTLKILNDVLCFELFNIDVARYRLLRGGDALSLSMQSSPSSLTSTPSSSSSLLFYHDSLSSSTFDSHSSSSTSATNVKRAGKPATDDLLELRSRLTTNALKMRISTVTADDHQQQEQNQAMVVTSAIPNITAKLNPRQLFIGCVPLHVKYGQLKLLFERFGEVTYVKVYEGYNKHTGAKMMHNYAFLFFKDETSVEKAIAASPVPLDANWNLNVSRPHHHANATTGGG